MVTVQMGQRVAGHWSQTVGHGHSSDGSAGRGSLP